TVLTSRNRADPASVFELRLSAARLLDRKGLAQLSIVERLISEVLFECGNTWWSGVEEPYFVAVNYCVNGCKSSDPDFRESATCAVDLSHGFRAWGETHPPPQAELR